VTARYTFRNNYTFRNKNDYYLLFFNYKACEPKATEKF